MSFVIYHKETTRLLRVRARSAGCFTESFAVKGAATQALNREVKAGRAKAEDYAIVDRTTFLTKIEKMVERVNLMSGKTYLEPVNTPNYCSPASEAYWSM